MQIIEGVFFIFWRTGRFAHSKGSNFIEHFTTEVGLAVFADAKHNEHCMLHIGNSILTMAPGLA